MLRTLKGVASVGDLPFDEGQDCGGQVICSPRKGWSGSFPHAEIGGVGVPGGSDGPVECV